MLSDIDRECIAEIIIERFSEAIEKKCPSVNYRNCCAAEAAKEAINQIEAAIGDAVRYYDPNEDYGVDPSEPMHSRAAE